MIPYAMLSAQVSTKIRVYARVERLTSERNECECDECRDSITSIIKVNLGDVTHHEGSDKDQDRSRGERRDVTEDRSEEDRDEEPK